jgi:hypothetical protein
MNRSWQTMAVAASLLCAAANASAQVCIGNCGTLGPNGDVTAPPGGTSYQWVSTDGGVLGVGLPGIGGDGEPTDGSVFRTAMFGALAGDELSFYFNYVTSDGAGFADYAWARLLNADLSEAALLFTARTTDEPGGAVVPGFAMPAPVATLTPATVTIIPGAPVWSPLGGDSGDCFATGCGYTGWVHSLFNVGAAGNYFLEFGVTNWDDQLFDSGLAFAGATIGGAPIDPPASVVPEPITMVLLGTGLAGVAAARRRRREDEIG